MRRFVLTITAVFALSLAAVADVVRAQDSLMAPALPIVPASRADSARSRLARARMYPWNGVNVWVGNAYETRSASHNQHFAGSMRMVGVQLSRDLWRGAHSRLTYIGEALPVIRVRSGPPDDRVPDTTKTLDASLRARYRFRDVFGVGLAPFGLEISRRLTPKIGAMMNMTVGALVFDKVVPYGEATKANFTAAPSAAIEWSPVNRTRIAFGYTFHHLSNAHFGRSNPGMNSQLLFVRVARIRSAVAGQR